MPSFYQSLTEWGQRVVPGHVLFKYAFNLSPMYRRTTGRVVSITPDLHKVVVRLPLSYRNRNYVGSIFGGSLYSAVDPFYMVQLLNILGRDYVVWDKAAAIKFRRPGTETLYADFEYTADEVAELKQRADDHGEFDFKKTVRLMDRSRERTFVEVEKTLYVATKAHYREKRARRRDKAPREPL